jgi:hypothetical protein
MLIVGCGYKTHIGLVAKTLRDELQSVTKKHKFP